MTSQLPVVPPKARAWLLTHPLASRKEAAAALGLSPRSIGTYRYWLIKQGLLSKRGMREKLRATCEGLRDGIDRQTLADELGVSPATITTRLARAHLSQRALCQDHVFSGQALAALFGYSVGSNGSYTWLERLRKAGLAMTRRGERGHWRVTAEALMAFLEDRRSWPLIRLNRIADPDWRAYAEEARRERAFRGGTLRVIRSRRRAS